MIKVAIYSRKSIFTGKGESIENQVEMCKDYYYRMYGTNVEFVIYEDEGFSGGNLKRPRFQELLKDVKLKKFKALICYRLDRISRNVADFSNTLELLQSHGVDFISIKENFDTSTPMGRAMIYISSVFAQLERETIAERVRDNMLQLSKTGRWLGGTPPIGFDSTRETYIDENFKERSLSKLAQNNDELKIVKEIYKSYKETESLNQTSKHFIINNIKGKLGGDLDKSGIANILQNPVYVKANDKVINYLRSEGYEVFGEPNGNGLLRYSQDTKDKIAAVSKHRGIIDADEWLEVQRILKSNTFKAPNSKSNTALLTGLLKCGKCGSSMNIKYGSIYKNNDRAFYYKCANKTKSGGIRCNASNINGDIAERLVIETISAYNEDALIKELENLIEQSKKVEVDKPKDLEKEISSLEDKIKRLISKLSLTDDIEISKLIMDQITENKKLIAKLKEDLSSEIDKEIEIGLSRKEIDDVLNNLKNFKYIFHKATTDEKRKLLTDLLEKIVWNEESKDIELYFNIPKKK
ncbi:recombinase family protein [Clostridium sp. HBUAS56017]|uniref:recombinase family protein n=1 Tax=Clostridium sp. HBUAS56017 TaxID=2571128 RepID=UPI001FAA4B1E|nr:recombinase family protein [Clostridium sp. HBUAS56017]